MLDARQDVAIPSRTPAVGSQPCGEHACVSLPVAGVGRADFGFGCSLISLSLSSGTAIVVSILYKAQKTKSHTAGSPRIHRASRVTDIHGTCTQHTYMEHMDTSQRQVGHTDKSIGLCLTPSGLGPGGPFRLRLYITPSCPDTGYPEQGTHRHAHAGHAHGRCRDTRGRPHAPYGTGSGERGG